MNVSQEDARESLSAVQDVAARTQRAVASAYANPLLILWGILWIIAFTATHFYIKYAYHIFITMGVVGGVGTATFYDSFIPKLLLKMILLNGLAGASPDCGFCCLFTS